VLSRSPLNCYLEGFSFIRLKILCTTIHFGTKYYTIDTTNWFIFVKYLSKRTFTARHPSRYYTYHIVHIVLNLSYWNVTTTLYFWHVIDALTRCIRARDFKFGFSRVKHIIVCRLAPLTNISLMTKYLKTLYNGNSTVKWFKREMRIFRGVSWGGLLSNNEVQLIHIYIYI